MLQVRAQKEDGLFFSLLFVSVSSFVLAISVLGQACRPQIRAFPQIPSKDSILGLHLAMEILLDLRWLGADLAIFGSPRVWSKCAGISNS
jgi:hypothetical protein